MFGTSGDEAPHRQRRWAERQIPPVETEKCFSPDRSRTWWVSWTRGQEYFFNFSLVECVPLPRWRVRGGDIYPVLLGPYCVCQLNKHWSILFVYLAPKLAFSTSTSRPFSSANSTALSPARAACVLHTAASFTSIIGNKVKEARVCRLGGGIPADQASV